MTRAIKLKDVITWLRVENMNAFADFLEQSILPDIADLDETVEAIEQRNNTRFDKWLGLVDAFFNRVAERKSK